ncbi:PDZ domain-containing protein [Xanthomonas campestris]|uniref:PDZ domain-containing protein n=1 Tax=Xanthomonas campestris TaxID=339 RepID=UPI001864EB44|nr:PDZ domain-containing protein [Xanthomonas campestris]
MRAATQTTGDQYDHQVLRVDSHQLRWQHNSQTLVLTAAAAGLLVADASNTLPLQLRKGDRLRSANGQGIASVADLLRALRAAAGTPVTVEVVREQTPLTLHWAASLYAPLLPPAPPPPPSPPRPVR